jgi:heme-binding protein
MVLSGRATRRALVGVIANAAMAGAMLFGGAALAFAQPTPEPPPPPPAAPMPGCTAADLAQVSGTVGTAMGVYLYSHPDVNNFFTSLRGLPHEEIRGRVQDYMNANPQAQSEINGIRQPLTDLRNRCELPPPMGE